MLVAYPQIRHVSSQISFSGENTRTLSKVLDLYSKVEMDLLDRLLPSHEMIERAKEIIKKSRILKFDIGRKISLNISFKDPSRFCFQQIRHKQVFSNLALDFLPKDHKIKAEHLKAFHFSFDDPHQAFVFQAIFQKMKQHFSQSQEGLDISKTLRLIRKKSYLDDVFLHFKALEYVAELKDPVFLVKPLLKQLITDLESFPREYLQALLQHVKGSETGFLKIIAAFLYQKLKLDCKEVEIPPHLESFYYLLEFLNGSKEIESITFSITCHLERLLLIELSKEEVLAQDLIFLRPQSDEEALFDLGYTKKSNFISFIHLMKDEKNAKLFDIDSMSLKSWPDLWIKSVLCVSALQYNKTFLQWVIMEISKHHRQSQEFSFYIQGFFVRHDIKDEIIQSYYTKEFIQTLDPPSFRSILYRATSAKRFELLDYFLSTKGVDPAFLRAEFEHMVKTDEAILLTTWIERFYETFDDVTFLKPLYDFCLRSLNDTIRTLFAQNFVYFAIGKGDIEKFTKRALAKFETCYPKYRAAFYLSLLAKEGLWEVYDRVLKKESAGFIHQDDYELLMKLAMTKNKARFYEFFLSKDFSKEEMIAILPLVNQECQGIDRAFFAHPKIQAFDDNDSVGFIFDMIKSIPHTSSVYPHFFQKAPFSKEILQQAFDLFAHRDQFTGLYVLKFSPFITQDMWDGLIKRYILTQNKAALGVFSQLGFPKLMPTHRTQELKRSVGKEFYDKHVASVFLDAVYQAQGVYSEFSTNGIKYQLTSPLFDPRELVTSAHHLRIENAKKA